MDITTPQAVGNEFFVNTTPTSDQYNPAVTALTGGGFVIVWHNHENANIDSDGRGVSGQLYDSSGNKVGTQFLINTQTAGKQDTASVQALNGGGFVVIWQSDSSATDNNGSSVAGQIFDASANKVGAEFTVNTETDGNQIPRGFARFSNDNFIVVWESADTDVDGNAIGISGQRFDNSGNKIGTEFTVNSQAVGNQLHPSVATFSNGNFVVSWSSYDPASDGDGSGISAQMYDATGAKLGTEFTVNTEVEGDQLVPQITTLTGGGFVIVWYSSDPDVDASSTGIAGQLFDASGNKVGTEFTVNTHTNGAQNVARVTSLDDGGFIVVWRSDDAAVDGSGIGISGQRFDSTGAKVGTEFNLANEVQSTQTVTGVADLGGGEFVATWQSSDPDVDSQGTGISARIFTANAAPTSSNNTVSTAEDTGYTFTASDFNFADSNSLDSLKSVRIDSTTSGLTLSGTAVSSAQVITVADITAGNLKYTPLADQNGSGIAGFGFSVNDGTVFSHAASTMTINVATTNDVPISPALNLTNRVNVTDADNAALELDTAIDIASATVSGTTFVFAAGNSDNGVSVFSLDSDGNLTNVHNEPDAGSLALTGIQNLTTATIGGSTFLYTVSAVDNGISVFSVANDGSLSSVQNISDDGTVALNNGNGIEVVTVGASHFLYTAGYGDHGVSAFSIAGDGQLTHVETTTDTGNLELQGANQITSIEVGGTNYLVVSGFDDNGLSIFSVAADGRLTNTDNVTDAGALELEGIRGLASATVGGTGYLFAAGTTDDGISVFSVSGTGKLTNVANVADDGNMLLDGAVGLSTMVISSTTYLMVSSVADNGISIFSIGNNGGLTHIQNIADTGSLELDGARALLSTTAGSDTFLIAAAQTDDGLSVFEQNSITLSTAEDTAHTFTTTDFPFADADGDTLQAVRIDATVSGLTLNNIAATNGQEIAVADITGGNLVYTPPANQSGATLATLQYSVGDGTSYTAAPTSRVIAVTSVEDLPTASDHTESIAANSTYTLQLTDLGYSDGDGDNLVSVRIDSVSLAAGDTLMNDTTPITTNSIITLKDIDDGDIRYTPATDEFGTGRSSFTFTVNDGKGDAATSSTFTFNVAQGNQAPTTSNNTISATEDTTYVFKAADFNFSDPDAGDTLNVVSISNLSVPAGDQLLYQGNTAENGDAITAAELANGDLKYIPLANANGAARVTFDFSVTDNHNKPSVGTSTLTVNVADVAEPSTGGGGSTGSSGSSSSTNGSSGNNTPPVTTGSSTGDELVASDQGENINAGSGADSVRGGAGDDSVAGGNGDDQIFAGPNDKGDDILQGNQGSDVLGGGAGADIIVGGDISDALDLKNLAFAGNDTMFGGNGDDLIIGGSYDSKTKTAHETGQGENLIWAGTGNDSVFGDSHADVIGGGLGNDSISAGGGNDIVYGGKGDPAQNNDSLYGGSGADKVFASVGEDDVVGGEGDDTLFGGAGDDTVNGGADDDEIWGGTGDDSLTGGDGKDTFAFISGFGTDTITDFSSTADNSDTLDLSGIEGLTLVELQAYATFNNGNAQLAIEDHGTIILLGVDSDELQNIIDNGQILVSH